MQDFTVISANKSRKHKYIMHHTSTDFALGNIKRKNNAQ
jgi:hypothetical protein